MPLDTRIALGVQPLQLADPLAREGQVQNILTSQAQQRAAGMQQQSAQMQMDQAQRQLRQDEDYVSQMTKAIGENGGPSDMMQAFRIMATHRDPRVSQQGVTGLQSLQRLDAAKKAGIYGTPAPVIPNAGPAPGAMGSGTFGMDQNVPMFNQRNVPPLNLTAPAPTANQLTPPAAAPVNQLGVTPKVDAIKALETRYATLAQFSDLPGVKEQMTLLGEQHKALLNQRNTAFAPIDASKYTPASLKAFNLSGDQSDLVAAPEKTKQTDLQINYQAAKDQGFVGSIFDYERKLKEATRAPAAPRPEPAPSITNIVDPTNPNQMIAIDTRRYQGGGVGSLGVIGASGKEPGAAVRTNKAEAGKTQLADDLENLRASFETLDRLRAIPSTERGALSNVTSGIASTAIGQRTGQFFATEAQVERDVINSARNRLVNSIKNATGMSAQQLNSNVELQTMLKSMSDPGQSYQSAIRIIDDIENAYVKGNGMPPKPGKPAAPKPSGGGAPPPPPGFKPD